MAYLQIDARVEEFDLPMSLIVNVGSKADGGYGISPGHLTEAQAGEYWDNMRPSWLEHCAQLRRAQADEALGGSPQGVRSAHGS